MIFSCGCTNPNFNMSTYEDGLLYFINSPEERNLRTATEMVGQTIISSEFMSTQIPPGMYGDYGTLLFREGKNQESRKALAKEMEIYPESRKFLQPMFEGISTSRDNKIIPPQSEPKGAPSFGNTIRSIMVWPPKDQTNTPGVSDAFMITISRPLLERGYYVFPVNATQTFLKESGIASESTLSLDLLTTLHERVGADALLMISIDKWVTSQPLMGLGGQIVEVGADYRLIDLKTGKELWQIHSKTQANEQVVSGAGGPIYAVTNDHRLPARVLNYNAVRAFPSAIPPGPYHFKFE
jgi:hypothetical protein